MIIQRTANKPKDHLTGKAPYRFESSSLRRRHTNPSIAADLLIERGGGMTGIVSAEPGGIRLIWGSTPAGGVITPLEQG